jgi:chromosome segregation ATPase
VRHVGAVSAHMTRDSDSKNGELVDQAGRSILHLLHKAADAADQDCRQAVEAAQRLSQQLQAARDRIAQLERDATAHSDRAERAEAWLNKIHGEIEEQFPQGGPKAPA